MSVFLHRHFNPRSPHGERLAQFNFYGQQSYISIHAPRTGSDIVCCTAKPVEAHFNPRSPHGERHDFADVKCLKSRFQSTLPARGATGLISPVQIFLMISIHAPRTGSDFFCCAAGSVISNFNPRSPHGERLIATGLYKNGWKIFQSTLPARGATRPKCAASASTEYFNPRSPHGERHRENKYHSILPDFNPRSPHGERLSAI